MSVSTVAVVLVLAAAAMALLGVVYSRRHAGTLEDHITARGTLGRWAGASTLVATGLGTWILFGPAEAATWGGISAVLGYAVGAGGFCLVFIPLGRRMREVMPDGHSLTEYLWHRFGKPIYLLTLVAMLFYMFIFMTAELTGMALIVALIADIPLWVTALVVMVSVLGYTLYGGLRASIFTDVVQLVIILPVVLTALVAGWIAVNGMDGFTAGLAEHAPQLTDITFRPGVEGGLALALAVTLTNLFHQGYWQRVFAAKDTSTLRSSFFTGGIVSAITVFALGLFGLAYVALGKEGVSSTAVFDVLFEAVPVWVMLLVMVAGLGLVMSSVDTIINAVASIIVVDLARAAPSMDGGRLLRIARIAILVAAVPVVIVAAQGYSVLYLFLLADLICSALAFPVFFGLYSKRYDALAASVSIVAGLVAGGLLFPDPTLATGSLIGAFALAFVVPIIVTLAFLLVRPGSGYDFTRLRTGVKPISG